MTPVSIIRDVWNPLGLHLNQKYLKSGKKRLSYGQFTKGRLRDQVSSMQNVRYPLMLHLNKIYLKSGWKWLSYGQVTHGRLRERLVFILDNTLWPLLAFTWCLGCLEKAP